MTEEDGKHTDIGFEICYSIEELIMLHVQLSQYKNILATGRMNQQLLEFLIGHYHQISRIFETGLKTGWYRGYELKQSDKDMIIKYLIDVRSER